jgi:hypothetical protein
MRRRNEFEMGILMMLVASALPIQQLVTKLLKLLPMEWLREYVSDHLVRRFVDDFYLTVLYLIFCPEVSD